MSFYFSVQLPTAEPSTPRNNREKRQFEGLDSSNSDGETPEGSGDGNTIKVKIKCYYNRYNYKNAENKRVGL